VVGQAGTTPVPDEYGKHASVTIPWFSRYFHSVARFPPLQPKLVLSQATMSSGERTTSTLPEEAIQNLSDRASDPANAQHEPHDYWSLMACTHPGNAVLASNEVGTAVTGTSPY